MSTFALLRLSAEKRRDVSGFGLVTITGWSSYLTSGRVAEFTLLDVDEKLGWILTSDTPGHDGEIELRIPATSVEHRLEVTVRLLRRGYVVSSVTDVTHWEVVEKSSCMAVDQFPVSDGLSYLSADLSRLAIHASSSSTKAITDGIPSLQLSWKRVPTWSRKSPLQINLSSSPHPLPIDRWRVSVAETDELSPAGVTEHVFVVSKEDATSRQRIIEVPADCLEAGVGYRVTVEGLVEDKIDCQRCSRVVCRNSALLQAPRLLGRSGSSFRIWIHRDSYSRAAVIIHSPDGFGSSRNIAITKIRPRSSWSTQLQVPRLNWQMMVLSRSPQQSFVLPLRFIPGAVYEVTVSEKSADTYKRIVHFRAELTPNDIHLLHEMALRYNFGDGCGYSAHCRWIYRNKTPEYFDDIRRNHGGIMKVYDKNGGGDPGCPINHRIKGLFFSASVDLVTGLPIGKSPFGTSRLLVPVEEMLRKASNLYFADFSCKGRPHHYVTLVMTRPGSEADRFCLDRLLPLNIRDRAMNPFFFYDTYLRQFRVTVRQFLLVELFFTENLDIRSYEVVEGVPTFGRGTSLAEGVQKNRFCRFCNLPKDCYSPYYDELF